MTTRANVHSVEAIESIRTALVSLVDQVRDALTALELEMRRVVDWLEHDRPRYWKTQSRLAADAVHDAQQALHRCLMYPIAGERPSCAEERAALKKAKARLAYCEAKQQRVRHWVRTVRHELLEYEGRISNLVRLAEIDAPQAIALLGQILRRLEEYQSIRIGSADRYDDVSLAAELWPEPAAPEPASDEVDRE